MPFYISNPDLGKIERLKLKWWAWRDAGSVSRANFDHDGYFNNPRIRSMAHKAATSCEMECTHRGARKWKDLRALYMDYLSALKKLEKTLSAGKDAVAVAEDIRFDEDAGLSASALKERCDARSVKPRRRFAKQEAELRQRLDELARMASEKHDLPGYEWARVTAMAHCRCAQQLHYSLPAERYLQYLLRHVDLQGIDAAVHPVEFTWPERIGEVFPELNFSQHENL